MTSTHFSRILREPIFETACINTGRPPGLPENKVSPYRIETTTKQAQKTTIYTYLGSALTLQITVAVTSEA